LLGATVGRVATGAESDDVGALENVADGIRAAILDAEQRISDGWNVRWQKEIAAAATVAPAVERSAAGQLLEHRDRERADRDERRAQVLDDVGRLLGSTGPRCEPDDLADLTGRYRAMSTMDRLDDVRAAALDLSVAAREAVERQKSRSAGEALRARLSNLLDDALPADRDRLRELVANATDSEDLAAQVHQAVRQADLERHRDLVAGAVRRALTDAGCEPADDFAELLMTDKETVVRLDAAGDYGLLVRLPEAGGQLLTAVVRADDVAADPGRDSDTQRDFCDRALPAITTSLARDGIAVDPVPFLLIEPGRLPVAPVPAARLGRRAGQRTRKTTTRVAPRERQR
jgi:hypothetical protein